MKKTKVKERFENAVEAFFDNTQLSENTSLDFVGDKTFGNKYFSVSENNKNVIFSDLLKQIFFFFPGTFCLFNMSLRLTVFMLNPTHGIEITSPLLLVFCSLMIILGVGNLKNIKHFAIPLSIFLFSAILGLFAQFSGNGLHFYYNYGVYFLPLALIVPFMTKSLIEKGKK